MVHKNNFTLLVAIIISIATIILGIIIGSVYIPLRDILAVFLDVFFKTGFYDGFNELNKTLILGIRLPRVLLAFLVGASLSLSGCILQTLLKNPLASAYSLGVSSASGLCAAIVMIYYTGAFSYQLMVSFGIFGSFVAVILILAFSQVVDKSLSTNTVVLTGMIASLFLNSVMTTLSSQTPEMSNRILLWQLGSFSSRGYTGVYVIGVVLPIVAIIFMMFASSLDIISFGSAQANNLGVNTKVYTYFFIMLVSILTSVSVCFVGIIGFIDLIVPHIVRRISSSNHKNTIPLNILIGGSFMCLCDILARSLVAPREIPIGSITALLGTPFFVFIYFKNRKENHNA